MTQPLQEFAEEDSGGPPHFMAVDVVEGHGVGCAAHGDGAYFAGLGIEQVTQGSFNSFLLTVGGSVKAAI